jgi:hypothetical protein
MHDPYIRLASGARVAMSAETARMVAVLYAENWWHGRPGDFVQY